MYTMQRPPSFGVRVDVELFQNRLVVFAVAEYFARPLVRDVGGVLFWVCFEKRADGRGDPTHALGVRLPHSLRSHERRLAVKTLSLGRQQLAQLFVFARFDHRAEDPRQVALRRCVIPHSVRRDHDRKRNGAYVRPNQKPPRAKNDSMYFGDELGLSTEASG